MIRFCSVQRNNSEAAQLLRDVAQVFIGPSQAPDMTTFMARQDRVQAMLSSLFRPYGSRDRVRARPRPFTTPWCHDFFCLSEPNTTSFPRPEEIVSLHSVGLGKRRVRFKVSKCSFREFCTALYEFFPALKDSGGFKIMRATRNKSLVDIPMPSGGYTIDYLRHESGLNRAMAYIVPLQQRLMPCNQQVDYIRLQQVVFSNLKFVVNGNYKLQLLFNSVCIDICNGDLPQMLPSCATL